jgi:cell division protein ZapA
MSDPRGNTAAGRRQPEPNPEATIRVEIYNQTYNIRSDGDGQYLAELAEYVDSRMREISNGTLTVDSLKVAILAALHITDELHRLRRQLEQNDTELATRSAEFVDKLDQVLRPRAAGDPQNNIAFR